MANKKSLEFQEGMMLTKMDVTDAMEDFEKGVANRTVLLGAASKASKQVMKPRVVAIYGGASGGPKRMTGAMSKNSATQVKQIWYKSSKTGVAIVGLKTNNESKHTLTGRGSKKAHKITQWHLKQINAGNRNKYRVAPGKTVTNPLGRRTILGYKAWKISDSVGYETKQYKTKTKKVIVVKRDPSRISHIIEKGHKWPRGGGKTTDYRVIEKAESQAGNATKMVMMNEMRSRAMKAAERAEQKAKA